MISCQIPDPAFRLPPARVGKIVSQLLYNSLFFNELLIFILCEESVSFNYFCQVNLDFEF